MTQASYRFEPVRIARLRLTMFRIQMDYLLNHAERVERLLTQERRDFGKRVAQEMKGMSAARGSEYAEDCAEEAHEIEEFSPRAFRAASFIYAYSEFEYFLHTLAEATRRDRQLKTSIHDVRKHRGIHRARVYLTKEAGLHFPAGTKEWNQIGELADLRNCLAHNGGQLPRDAAKRRQVMRIVKRWPDLSVDQQQRVTIHDGFLSKCIEIFQAFAHRLRTVV